MIGNVPFWRTTGVTAVILVVLVSLFGTSPALAARDRKPPTKPTNLRATSLTPHNVTLAWNPSTDDSGTFSYRVWVSYGFTYTVAQTQTTFSLGLVPNNTYSFYVY
ncbi:MAG: fibronectin type III domain-containing protein, partial [Chloroflexota bacterium]|nr:fibronectin type III domain-containing protein [Chloroflexota bacterium]